MLSPSVNRGSDGEQIGDEKEEIEYHEHENGLQPEQPERLVFRGLRGLERVAFGVGDRIGVIETAMEGEVVLADEPPTAVRTHRVVVRRGLVRVFVGHGGALGPPRPSSFRSQAITAEGAIATERVE